MSTPPEPTDLPDRARWWSTYVVPDQPGTTELLEQLADTIDLERARDGILLTIDEADFVLRSVRYAIGEAGPLDHLRVLEERLSGALRQHGGLG